MTVPSTDRDPGPVVRLDETAALFTGLSMTRLRLGADAMEIPTITIKDVGDGIGREAPLEMLSISASQAARFAVAAGDVVVTARSTTVRAAVVPPGLAGAVLGANLFAVRVDDRRLSATLLAAYLELPAVQETLLARRRGATVPGMNIGDLAALRVALPARARQDLLEKLLRLSTEHRRAVSRALELRATACAERVAEALAPDIGGQG